MKKLKQLRLVFIGLFFGSLYSNAQSFDHILVAGQDDASLYLENYLEPVLSGLVQNLNSGWYHTGKTHKKYGFDFTINATASFVPDDKKRFLFRNSDYNVLELASGNSQEYLPTVMGQTTNEQINVKIPLTDGTGFKVARFDALDGIEDELPVAAVPSPMIQIGFGLPSKTDFKIRFVPKIGSDEVKFNLIGIGLQHNILQYFKLDKVTPFDLSVLGAFTTSTTTYIPKDGTIPGRNQETTFKINAYTVQVVGNVDLKVINFYAGLGYSSGNASVLVKGTYEFQYDIENTVGIITDTIPEEITDPINIHYKMSKQLKATLGMRLNLSVVKLFADYSFQDYGTLNAGLAISFK